MKRPGPESDCHRRLMCCFLLFLIETPCFCEPTFVVKVTQSSYQAEENHNITLEWTFTNTQGSFLIIFCEAFTDHNGPKALYHLREGVEDTKTQDKQFSGRVQCDRDVLREGRVRLHVSRLRTEDSGLYQCEVSTGYGSGSDECRLNVTEAVAEPEPETPRPERPGPESWRVIAISLAGTIAALSVLLVVILCYRDHRLRMRKVERKRPHTAETL